MTLTAAIPVLAEDSVETIEVVATTPAGTELDSSRVAANVQRALADEIRDQRTLGLAQFMEQRFANVIINSAQNNPLQPDVQFRGFVGSPLLGLPQGIAVYQDGVRINEPFGDTVSWALIPENAIDQVYLLPGSNPIYGLNALGGALAIRTKTGATHPGTSVEAHAGSHGRTGIDLTTGGSVGEAVDYFVALSWLDEDGWRDFSPTEAAQAHANVGWHAGEASVDVDLTFANTDLIGNGAAPTQLLDLDRAAIFTRPDRTENELLLTNLTAEYRFNDVLAVTGTLYRRTSDVATYNGDDSDFEECEDTPGFICAEEDEDEEFARDASGNVIPASETLVGGTVNRSRTNQDTLGFVTELTATTPGRTFTLGLALDESDIEFAARTELGSLDETRRAIPGGVFIGDAFTDLDAEVTNRSIYVASNIDLTKRAVLSLSGRYNQTDVTLRDQLGTALTGDHEFKRFNPAVGLTMALAGGVGAYASYAESNRAPSPVELTCADPDDPCRLPNAFLADPPLADVVAKTIEAGIRGKTASEAMQWQAGVYRTANEDDILFISAGALTNEGFFDNVGRTRREGIELMARGRASNGFEWFANYAYLRAQFREDLTLPSPNNPLAVDGEITVNAADRLPLLPSHTVKLGGSWAATDSLTLSANVLFASGASIRGDEGNDLDELDAYEVVNLRGEYRVNDRLTVFFSIENLLDEQYETFGLLGEGDEVLGDGFDDPRFLSPAAPRAAWLGVRARL
jgi:outer membrane receptor protein involved in Fe transport